MFCLFIHVYVLVVRFKLKFVFVFQISILFVMSYVRKLVCLISFPSAMKSVFLAVDSVLILTSDSLRAPCGPDFLHLQTTTGSTALVMAPQI